MHCNIPVHSAGRTYSMVMKPMVAQQIGEIVVLFMIEPWNLVTLYSKDMSSVKFLDIGSSTPTQWTGMLQCILISWMRVRFF